MSFSKDFRKFVIIPTLQDTGTYCQASEILVYGTGHVETNYDYLMQLGTPKNGGISLFQEEPSDFFDVSQYLINGFNKGMLERVLSACGISSLPKDPMCLIYNLRLAVMYCRLHYWRIKYPLPDASNAAGMAQYHKVHYNSSLGAADVDKNTEIFQRIINGDL